MKAVRGISRPGRARVKPGVAGARADCPPSQPLGRLCTSRVLSSISIAKSWSSTSTGESHIFPPLFRPTRGLNATCVTWAALFLFLPLRPDCVFFSFLFFSFFFWHLFVWSVAAWCARCFVNKRLTWTTFLVFNPPSRGCSGAFHGVFVFCFFFPSDHLGCAQLLSV